MLPRYTKPYEYRHTPYRLYLGGLAASPAYKEAPVGGFCRLLAPCGPKVAENGVQKGGKWPAERMLAVSCTTARFTEADLHSFFAQLLRIIAYSCAVG